MKKKAFITWGLFSLLILAMQVNSIHNHAEATTEDPYIQLYDNTGANVWSYTESRIYGYVRVDMSWDGRRVVAVNDDPMDSRGCGLWYFDDMNDGLPGWSGADGAPVWTFIPSPDVGTNDFYGVGISGNGEIIATGPARGSYVLSNVGNVPLQAFTMGCGQSYDLTFDGRFGACGNRGGEVWCFSKDSSIPLWNYAVGGIVHSVAIQSVTTPTDLIIAAGSSNGYVYVFDETGALLWRYYADALYGNAGGVVSVAMSDQGEYIAVGSYHDKLYLFDATGHKLWEKSVPISISYDGGWMGTESKSVAISADGQYIVAGGTDKLYLYDNVGTLIWSHNGRETCVAISPDGNYIAACNYFGEVHLFSRTSSTPLWTMDVVAFWVAVSDSGYVAVSASALPVPPPPPIYDATIDAYCYTELSNVSVSIMMDGSPTGYNTPHTFTDLTGTHTFTVPSFDLSGHPFKQWSTGETSTTITVNTGGTYIAHYWVSGPGPYGPHLSKVEFALIKSPDLQVKAMKLGIVDMYPGLIRPGDVEELYYLAGKKIIYGGPGDHFCYFTFNLRNYTIAEPPGWGAGYPASYGKRFLMDPWFRLAVAHLVPKHMLIAEIFKYIAIRVDSVVPLQMCRRYYGGKYVSPNVPEYWFDPLKAVSILGSHGYDQFVDHWEYEDDGEPLDDIVFLSPSFEEAPTSYTIVKKTVVEMHRIGLTNIQHIGMTFSDMLGSHVHPHAFDMMLLSWKGFGPDPDHLWAFFNSVNDVYGGRNHPGVCDPDIDYLTNIIHTGLQDWGEVVPAALEVQELLMDPNKPYGLCYIPIYSRRHFDAYHPDLECILIMPLIGSDNYWTFLNMRWWDGVGPHGDNSLVCNLATEITSLNPLTTAWADEVEIQNGGARGETEVLSLVFDRLMHKNPYTLEDIYGMAEYHEIERYIGPSEEFGPVDGMKFTYRLREDVYWHCGAQFTTEDVKFAFDKMAEWQPSLWINAWEDYVGTNIIDSRECEIYYNKTSLWLKDTVETVAAMLPKHIWEGVTDWEHFDLWNEDHPGNIQIPGAPAGHYLKKLCGTGPFIFDYNDPAEMYTVLYPNPNYWKSQIDVEIELAVMFHSFGDTDRDGMKTFSDILEVYLGWASSKWSDPERYWIHRRSDLNNDYVIDVRDLVIVCYGMGTKKWY